MNLDHLKAFVWLRWRIRRNQLRKGGIANQVILLIFSAMLVISAVGLFFGGIAAGYIGLPAAPSPARLLIWDGVVVVFLFVWMIGLLAELQRSDPLTLDKFLHLPVSPAGVFVINYVSSLASITLGLFAATAVGILIGQLFAVGPIMLLAVPLFLAFVLAVTAVTYQFQGWLAVLMSNPRRRRTVVVLVTLGFILLVQIPNLVNLATLKSRTMTVPTFAPPTIVQFDPANPNAPLAPAPPPPVVPTETKEERDRKELEQVGDYAWYASVAFPPGWFPVGAAALTNGNVVPALLGTLGFTLIGGFCLWRAYRTTVRFQTGQTDTPTGKPVKVVAAPTATDKPRLVEWQLPWVNERAAAVATGAFRGLLRAPEAKMMMLAPIIMVVVFGGLMFGLPMDKLPGVLRPVMAVGATAFIFVAGVQLAGNMFGFDRAGFRAYVLSPIPRRDILLGKNLANAPLTVGVAGIVALLVGIVLPMRWDHYPTVLLMLAALYLCCCLLTNALSIIAPIPLAAGAMQPAHVKMTPILWQFGFMMVYPFVLAAVLAPLGVEALIEETTDA